MKSIRSKKSGQLPQGGLCHSLRPRNLYLFEPPVGEPGFPMQQSCNLKTDDSFTFPFEKSGDTFPLIWMRECLTATVRPCYSMFARTTHKRYSKCIFKIPCAGTENPGPTHSNLLESCKNNLTASAHLSRLPSDPVRTCHSAPCSETNQLEPPQVLNADLHFVSSSLVRRQHEHKTLCSPDMRVPIETVGREEALAACFLYRELISWRDLCALFQVCRVSEGATHHSAPARLLHIWRGSFRVTCTRTETHRHTNTHLQWLA